LRHLLRSLILMALFICAASRPGWTDDVLPLADVLRALEAPFSLQDDPQGGRIASFRANFRQASHIASIDKTQLGTGQVRFHFVPRGQELTTRFHWSYDKPEVQVLISDGETMWFYLPDNRQVIESSMTDVARDQGQNPVTFLRGLAHLERDFTPAWADIDRDGDGHPVIMLRPKKPSQFIDHLDVTVQREAVDAYRATGQSGRIFPLKGLSAVDLNGNRTSIAFEDVEINPVMPDDLFQFRLPAGVEVVRPGQQFPGY